MKRKYTVTKTVEKEANISSETMLAIGTFKDILRIEKRLGKANEELQGWLHMMPKEEINVYMEITESMRIEQEKR